MDKPDEERARAEMSFKGEQQVLPKETETARQKYEADGLAVRVKMARLRDLRLAKEAKEKSECYASLFIPSTAKQ